MISALSKFVPLRNPLLWWTGFATWAVTLWILSANRLPEVDGPKIPHADKVAHFVYFAAGALCLGAAVALAARKDLRLLPLGLVVILVIAAIGALDEWHQTFTAGRMGADVFDWLADALGGVAGVFLARKVLRELK